MSDREQTDAMRDDEVPEYLGEWPRKLALSGVHADEIVGWMQSDEEDGDNGVYVRLDAHEAAIREAVEAEQRRIERALAEAHREYAKTSTAAASAIMDAGMCAGIVRLSPIRGDGA